MVIRLRDELYEGSWSQLRGDLVSRKSGRAFLFKLAGRIEEDLERIDKLEAYEKKNEVNLNDYL
ncbi:MAG: hypothetical protein O6952_06250 [Planctomycetota bacterium]|nr:hypothetical protein [Planctomycetota bacterium]